MEIILHRLDCILSKLREPCDGAPQSVQMCRYPASSTVDGSLHYDTDHVILAEVTNGLSVTTDSFVLPYTIPAGTSGVSVYVDQGSVTINGIEYFAGTGRNFGQGATLHGAVVIGSVVAGSRVIFAYEMP